VTVVASGVTVHEALTAADRLAADGLRVRVIDAYSIKPNDAPTLREAARDPGRIITVEDHWPEGGLGDAVLDVFADARPSPLLMKLAVSSMPASASPDQQLRAARIDADAIADAARALAGVGHREPVGTRT
jgi:transketolase